MPGSCSPGTNLIIQAGVSNVCHSSYHTQNLKLKGSKYIWAFVVSFWVSQTDPWWDVYVKLIGPFPNQNWPFKLAPFVLNFQAHTWAEGSEGPLVDVSHFFNLCLPTEYRLNLFLLNTKTDSRFFSFFSRLFFNRFSNEQNPPMSGCVQCSAFASHSRSSFDILNAYYALKPKKKKKNRSKQNTWFPNNDLRRQEWNAFLRSAWVFTTSSAGLCWAINHDFAAARWTQAIGLEGVQRGSESLSSVAMLTMHPSTDGNCNHCNHSAHADYRH